MLPGPQDLIAAAVLGLAGSTHCVAMCGPLVAGLSVAGGDLPGARKRDLAWQTGRLISYLAVGGVTGLLGATVNGLALKAGLPAIAALLGGLLMIAVGLGRLLPERLRPGQALFARGAGRGGQLDQELGEMVNELTEAYFQRSPRSFDEAWPSEEHGAEGSELLLYGLDLAHQRLEDPPNQ